MSDLELPRQKPRRLAIAAGFRLFYLLRRIVPARLLLIACLDLSWLFHRFAHEAATDVYRDAFTCVALGSSEEVIAAWLPSETTIVDLGCGDGRWCRALARRFRHVTGIDRDTQTIDLARQLTSASNVTYIAGDIVAVAQHGRFGAALLIHVLEHIDDPETFLRRVATSAGRLIVEVPDVESDALNAVRRWLGRPFYSDADHVREYTGSLLEQHLTGSGWRIEAVLKRGGGIVALASREQFGGFQADALPGRMVP